MTRINLVPVEDLKNKHLLAEYREMPMVPASLNRTLKSKKGLVRSRISKKYTLNAGHVYFFYDKGKFLDDRYSRIVEEMKKRGWNPDPNRIFPATIFKENNLYGDYEPSNDEINISNNRIQLRINQKPHLYFK